MLDVQLLVSYKFFAFIVNNEGHSLYLKLICSVVALCSLSEKKILWHNTKVISFVFYLHIKKTLAYSYLLQFITCCVTIVKLTNKRKKIYQLGIRPLIRVSYANTTNN